MASLHCKPLLNPSKRISQAHARFRLAANVAFFPGNQAPCIHLEIVSALREGLGGGR